MASAPEVFLITCSFYVRTILGQQLGRVVGSSFSLTGESLDIGKQYGDLFVSVDVDLVELDRLEVAARLLLLQRDVPARQSKFKGGPGLYVIADSMQAMRWIVGKKIVNFLDVLYF